MAKTYIMSDSRYPVDRGKIRAAVKRVLDSHQMTSELVVSIAVVGDRKMRTLNREYHEIDATTDVLSFPYLDPISSQDVGAFIEPLGEVVVLGDLVISYPEAVRQARVKGVLVDDEIDFLIEHGMMHLLGIHHD